MIAGLLQLLAFQGAGEILSRVAVPMIPGPVIGLVLLVAWLRLRKAVPAPLDLVAGALVQHLGLLFVPAAVGVVMFWPHLRAHALAVAVALVVSVVSCIAVSALVLRWISGDAPRER